MYGFHFYYVKGHTLVDDTVLILDAAIPCLKYTDIIQDQFQTSASVMLKEMQDLG